MNDRIKSAPKTAIAILLLCITQIFTAHFITQAKVNYTYTYNGERILTHTSKDIWYLFFGIIVSLLISLIVFRIIYSKIIKIKHKAKTLPYNATTLLLIIFCLPLTLYSVITIMDDSNNYFNYYPEYYEFNNNEHKIVICEESYLLMGKASIYYVDERNNAYHIGKFSTDDGYRNYGNYKITWEESGAKILCNYSNTEEKTEIYVSFP